MTRADPFGNLDDFEPQTAAKRVSLDAIEELSSKAGFPSRRATVETPVAKQSTEEPAKAGAARQGRRYTTGRNRQINIKATDDTIERLYAIADRRNEPLGAVLEAALDALERQNKN